MSENPEDWRSAVDATSGRTYWYHRKTRVSTWIRPDFAEPTNNAPSTDSQAVDAGKFLKTEQIQSSIQSNDTATHTKQLASISQFRRSLKKIAQSPRQAYVSDLQVLLESVDKHEVHEEDAGDIISELVHVSMLSQDGHGTRHVALRCLFALAQAKQYEYAARFFHTHQAWTSLAAYTSSWKKMQSPTVRISASDPESILLVTALFCTLHIGPTYYAISAESKDCLVELLDATFIQSTDSIVDFDVLFGKGATTGTGGELRSSSSAVLTDRTVQTFTLLAEKGHSLPAVWLLAVFTQSFRSEKLFVLLVQMGFLQALKALCISSKLDADLKATARECLLSAMASSGYVRDRVLDSLLDLGADLSSVPVPMGPEPILYCATNTSESSSEEQAEEELQPDSGEPAVSSAQSKYKEMAAAGYCDVPVVGGGGAAEEGEQQDEDIAWDAFNRDVEWIPKSGTPWRLSSSLLWARCPALRELISGFWDEGGGGLELSINACDEVLASLCRYMHTGLLVLPMALPRQLELLRVSSELGMITLYLSASEALQQKLTMESVPSVISFCAQHAFTDLERACRTFLSTGGRRATVIRYQPSGDLNPQNAYLRDAIFASLQDVNTVLNQHPPSQTKLKVEAPAKNAAAVPVASHPRAAASRQNSRHLDLDEQLSNMHVQGPYEDEDSFSASLLDLAAGRGTGLSRENSYSNEANTFHASHSRDCDDGAYAVREAYSKSSSQAVEYTGSLAGAAGASKAAKHRGVSGGIYGLLLQGPGSSEASRYSSIAVPTKAANVPGKVAPDRRPGSAGLNPKAKLTPAGAAAASKDKLPATKTGGGAGPRSSTSQQTSRGAVDPSDATPRTQRASSLLASARPSSYVGDSAYNQFSTDEYDDQQQDDDRHSGYDGYGGSDYPYGLENDWQGDASFVDSDEGLRSGEPQEFSTQMSLAPQRDKTPNEKRIERLTRPTKVLGVADKNAKKRDSVDTDEGGASDDNTAPEEGRREGTMRSLPAAATSPVTSAPKTIAVNATPTVVPEGLAKLKAGMIGGKPAQQRPGSDSSGLVALKRSVSPTTSHSSRDGHLLSLGSSFRENAADSSDPLSPPPRSASSDINVRGSLTLLKTKTAGSRRRRSVADIEGAQEAPQVAASIEETQSTTTESASNISQGRAKAASSAGSDQLNRETSASRRNPAHVSLDLTAYLPDDDEVGADDHQHEPHFQPTDEFGAGQQPSMICPTCSRKFNPLPFEKHVKVCAKVFLDKRKAFDSAKMRLESNPDLKTFVDEVKGVSGRPGPGKKGKPGALERKASAKEVAAAATATAAAGTASKWKEQSDAFRAAMKNARDVSVALATGAPLPPPIVSAPDSSLVPCPHCQRRFSASAAERHIPVCQSIRAKPAPLKRGGGGNASSGGTGGPSSAVKGRNWQ